LLLRHGRKELWVSSSGGEDAVGGAWPAGRHGRSVEVLYGRRRKESVGRVVGFLRGVHRRGIRPWRDASHGCALRREGTGDP
jgi:hypothetical protein